MSDRVAYIYRRMLEAFERREWQVPPSVPRIRPSAAERLERLYDEYWAQYDYAQEIYVERLTAMLELGGEFTGEIPCSDAILPDFESAARKKLGADRIDASGHTVAINYGDVWRWVYLPKGVDTESDELDSWCLSFGEAAPELYRAWLTDFFVF